ncbi:MAG: zinc ribbon domain-containing protein [Candidatus Aegiribacteria sp.]
MKLCSYCKVEVEEGSRFCPLCGNPIPPWTEEENGAPIPLQRKSREAERSIRRWLLEAFSLMAVTGVLVVLAADIGSGESISWAHYPVVFIAFTWVSVIMGALISRRTWIYLPAQTAAVCLFLYSLDRFTPGPDWFVPLALPVTLLTGTVLALTLITARKLNLSAIGSVIAAMMAAGVLAVGLELLINRHLHRSWYISWSAVVFGCLLLLVPLLLYLRRWLRVRRNEIRKLLHI